MSYQVLARKWRPRTFREMVGQEHVLKALINALDHGRLHHAYLFTGTRGVGKTTIARILAKSLNCEVGISSAPCGQCSACTEIDEGRFVDLIEVDAASRTKVEDTREILDNVQYAPTRGRYKVYLIDEVHMLSGHSFNALLKTLEEPPEHVKFLLATTDPQKLPITILSRCLQFSLKAMSPERIVGHLKNVLEKEMVEFEEPALWALGRAADGSMRDAMSLTDQAISFGSGKVAEMDVRAMLGSIDREYVYQLLNALMENNGENLLATIAQMSEQSPDYMGVLADLISALHRIAMAQVAPDAVDDSDGSKAQVVEMANKFTAEAVQLYYQTALLGRRDLPLAPDARSGFEMVLLRMMLFRPEGIVGQGQSGGGAPVKKPNSAAPVNQVAAVKPAAPVSAQPSQPQAQQPSQPPSTPQYNEANPPPPNYESEIPSQSMGQAKGALDQIRGQLENDSKKPSAPKPSVQQKAEPAKPKEQAPGRGASALEQAMASGPKPTTVEAAPKPAAKPAEKPKDVAPKPVEKLSDPWADLLSELPLNNSVLNFARNCCMEAQTDDGFALTISPKHEVLLQPQQIERLEHALSEKYGKRIKLQVTVGQPSSMTPDELMTQRRQQKLQRAEQTLMADPFVQVMMNSFGAVMDKESLQPLEN